MSLLVKVCGLTDEVAVDAAARGGATWFGFVFYPPSPRSVTATRASELAAGVPDQRDTVGVMVDPDDRDLAGVLESADLDLLQLHGHETPERVDQIRTRTGLRIIKAIKVGDEADLRQIGAFAEVADHLLFDAKPAEGTRLPGGNGRTFDWQLLGGLTLERPWLLSGGLEPDNLETAIALTGARAVDVSSGVEASPGVKDPDKIRRFLAAAGRLGGEQVHPRVPNS